MFWTANQLQELVEIEHFEDVYQIPQIHVKTPHPLCLKHVDKVLNIES